MPERGLGPGDTMDLQLLFDEFSASMVRARDLTTEERLSDWSAAVKSRLVKLAKRRGYVAFANDDRRKSGAYLWDVAWCVEDKLPRRAAPKGAGIPGLTFPHAPYRRLVLTAQVEWGRRGLRRGTQVFRQNLEEVFRDFYKLMDARSSTKVMVYTSWLYPGQSGAEGLFLEGFRRILQDYEGHLPGDQYLFLEFDDVARLVRGYAAEVPRRGPKTFRMKKLGEAKYPRKWEPSKN